MAASLLPTLQRDILATAQIADAEALSTRNAWTDKQIGILSFNLGGVNVSFQPVQAGLRLLPAPAYRDFVFPGVGEVLLRVHAQAYRGQISEAPRFETGNWALYDAEDKVVLQRRFPGLKRKLDIHTVVLNPDGLSGDLYAGEGSADVSGAAAFEVPPYSFDEILTACFLARRRGLLFHACGISQEPRPGLMFAGVSGAGKSTTAGIWQQVEGATLLSDERVAVRKQDGRYWLYGTPWHGAGQVSIPGVTPLGQVFILQHASRNQARRLAPAEAVSLLLVRAYLPFWDAQGMAFTLEFLDELCQSLPVYELGFVPDASMVEFVRCLSVA